MKTVKLKEPGLFNGAGRVQVTKDGRPFYVFDAPGQFQFTLPAGTYKMEGGTFIRTMPPKPGHSPTSQLRFPMPKRVKLLFHPNPYKACISLRDGVIVADPSLKQLPFYCLVFVLFHEIGHYYYTDEAACDRFAADEMNKRGYTPSQINHATHATLGDEHRRRCNFDNAKRYDR